MIYPAWGFGSSAVYCHTAADCGQTSKGESSDCVSDMKSRSVIEVMLQHHLFIKVSV